MNQLTLNILLLTGIFYVQGRKIIAIDQNWVCNTKLSCVDCLRLTICHWCESKNACFSSNLTEYHDYCPGGGTAYENIGFSLEWNAECTCTGGKMQEHCLPPGAASTDEPCSGRGACICGRCVCKKDFDVQHPAKMIMGEYCEYDNFSCDGSSCGEGPYPLHPPVVENKMESNFFRGWAGW